MNNKAGSLLAETIKELSSSIGSVVSEEGMVTKEAMGKLLQEVVSDFNSSMKDNTMITQGSLDILLLALANYSLLERQVIEGSGLKLDNSTRNTVLDKTYHIMKTGKVPQ